MRTAFAAVERHESVSSTNTHLAERVRAGAVPFTAVIAREQTGGRGRGGKGWLSARDAGLWMSVFLPSPPGGPPGVASLAVGVAVARAVEGLTGRSVGLKWPNDLLVQRSGPVPGLGKLGGVLCESVRNDAGGGVVAGVGVNLRRPVADSGGDASELKDAAFLDEVAGRRIEVEELSEAVGRELRRWADPPPETLAGELREEWDRRDLLRGRRVVTEMAPPGVAVGLDVDGSLRVSDEGGRIHRVRGGSARLAVEEVGDEAPRGTMDESGRS